MMPRIPDTVLAEIRARLPLAEVAARHTALRKSGRTQAGRCPLHQGRSENFHVYPDQHFHCFGCGAHGDVIRFVMQAERCDFPTAAARCAQDAGVALAGDVGDRPAPRPMLPPPPSEEDEAAEGARRRELARQWWCEAADIAPGSPAAAYLASRHLWPLLPAEAAVLRQTRLRLSETGGALHPVLLARIDDHAGQGCAVWRIYLEERADRRVGKLSGVGSAKRGYGPLTPGCAVRLAPLAPQLAIAEGIETALAATRLTGLAVWSVLSTTGMQKFLAPEGVSRIVVLADRDPPQPKRPDGPGVHAALALASSIGVPIEIRRPLPPHGDYADVWAARQGVAA